MAYMRVCPKCRSFFKVKTKDADIKCPKCSYQHLLDLKMDDEAWGTLTSNEKKIIIRARISEEGLQDVVASAGRTEGTVSPSVPASGEEEKQVKTTVKKVVKKKVVKKVVKRVVKQPEEALKEKEPVSGRKDDAREEALLKTVKPQETAGVASEAAKTEKKPEIKPKIKPKEPGDFSSEQNREDELGIGEKKEEKSAPPKKEKTQLNRKYVAIVAGTAGALLLYLFAITFIIPSFRMSKELPTLRSAEAGDTVYFGKYKGQNEWVVLDKKGTRILCISDYPIYGHDYYDEDWEDSALRKWFNSVFINSSFNVFERLRITSTKDIMKEDPDYTRDVGADTPDKVFIITERELNDYLHQYRDAMMRVNDDDIRAVCWIETK